jgi:hypothetical protein
MVDGREERDELNILLARHHFGELSCFGAYDPSVPAGATDRLVVVAQRAGAAPSGLQPTAAAAIMTAAAAEAGR